MPDRDELVRRALVDAAAPRPLTPATRDRLSALVRDDADARVAALLRAAATPRALPAAARTGLRARLSTGAPARRPAAGVGWRLTLALVSAAAVVVVGATAVVLRPEDAPGPVARPAPTGSPTASPGRSEQPAPPPPPPPPPPPSSPVATVGRDAGEAPGAAVPRGSSGPGGPSPSMAPRSGEEPAGAPGAPAAPATGVGGPQPQRSVSDVLPEEGRLAGGTVITVRGTGLSSVVRVEVGGRRSGSVRIRSDSELTARTPAGTRAGGVPVVVVMADGARYGLSPGFRYVAAPVLEAVSPDRGPTAGGNTVVLSGDHFRADAVVRFGTARAEVRHVSPTSIEVVAPGHLVGPVDVTVTTLGGTSAGRRYTYLPA